MLVAAAEVAVSEESTPENTAVSVRLGVIEKPNCSVGEGCSIPQAKLLATSTLIQIVNFRITAHL